MVVVEINLPSGVGPVMYEVNIVSGGSMLELTCLWPAYLLDPLLFKGKWMAGTGEDHSVQMIRD